MKIEHLTVEEPQARLDRYIADRLGLSRTRVQALLADGRVLVDGRTPRKSEPLEEGQEIQIEVPDPEPVDIEAEDIPLNIVHEDEHLLVIDKAPGMVVHPAPGHRSGTLVNALMHHIEDLSGVGGRLRPGIVHRLDKDTSGLLLVAKSDGVHLALSAALRRREIMRLYLAATWGHLSEREVRIDAPIDRHPRYRRKRAVRESGKPAVTSGRVLESWFAADLIEVKLETGRTHQIRVHFTYIGHPVVGDSVYGSSRERGFHGTQARWAKELARRTPRQFLHAARLRFLHPVRGQEMTVEAPLPADLASVADWARASSTSGS